MSKLEHTQIYTELSEALDQLLQQFPLDQDQILVVGASTSEVMGGKIGTAGSEAVASALYRALWEAKQERGFHLAIQCCEHLNRALVVEKQTAQKFQLDRVSVVPVPQAGGAMAAYTYKQLNRPVIVEQIQADAGIDIGETLIGMHLKQVAVPFRPSRREIGAARLSMATTRPKLIGGARAVYILEEAKPSEAAPIKKQMEIIEID